MVLFPAIHFLGLRLLGLTRPTTWRHRPLGFAHRSRALSDPAEKVAVTVARRDGCMVDIVGWTGKCPYL